MLMTFMRDICYMSFLIHLTFQCSNVIYLFRPFYFYISDDIFIIVERNLLILFFLFFHSQLTWRHEYDYNIYTFFSVNAKDYIKKILTYKFIWKINKYFSWNWLFYLYFKCNCYGRFFFSSILNTCRLWYFEGFWFLSIFRIACHGHFILLNLIKFWVNSKLAVMWLGWKPVSFRTS